MTVMKWTLLLFQTVSARGWSTAVGSGERVAGMLEVAEGKFKSLFAWVKQPARRATWSRFRAHAERMEKVDGLGDSVFWVGEDTAGEGGRAGRAGEGTVGGRDEGHR